MCVLCVHLCVYRQIFWQRDGCQLSVVDIVCVSDHDDQPRIQLDRTRFHVHPSQVPVKTRSHPSSHSLKT